MSDSAVSDGLSGRARSLDGLRGVAAVVVVVHHALLTLPALAPAYAGGRAAPGWDWLVHSPAHLLWAGNEAVMVFFLLSGIVLTLPVLRNPRFDWRAYYPSRLVRLYLPAAASVVLAVALILAVPRAGLADRGDWLAAHAEPLTGWSVARALLLVFGADYLNSPLWSLQLEVLFSLLLPLYVVLAVKSRRVWWVAGVGALLLSAVGARFQVLLVEYLPIFLIGCLIAARQDLFARAASIVRGRPGAVVGTAALVVALLAIVLRWLTPTAQGLWVLITVELGAVLLVLLAIYWPPLRSVLEMRWVQWLGMVSFSLYLVHEPVLVTVAALLPRDATWLAPLIGVPIAVLLSVGFFRVVERPAHRLSQRMRQRIVSRRSNRIGGVPVKS